MKFNKESFEKWENETTIPSNVMGVVNGVFNYLGIPCPVVETIKLYNRGGHIYAYAKGFSITHCTSSYADGPSEDYSIPLSKFLKGLGFYIENSYGDNGMDSATNWHDTFWTNEFVYKDSIVYDEKFIEYDADDDYEL